jgi:ADP-ribose pyrophosphatase YjhB (NUDIX family)
VISAKDAVKGRVLVSVAAVIEGKGHEILFIREADVPYHDWWVVPGGYLKPEESLKEALVREVKEETGLEVLPTRLIGVYDDFFSKEDEPTRHVIIAYEAIVVDGRIVFSQEAKAYTWLSVEEALRSQVPDVFKRILGDFKNQKANKIVSWFRRRSF